jgi:hypothetical protein
MAEAMVKDAHWVSRINDLIVPKIKRARNIHDACRKYFEILEEIQQEISHKDDEQCRCPSIILQSKHAWIADAEPEYRKMVERAVFTQQPPQGQTRCWLRNKVEYYRSAATAFDIPHIRQRYQDLLLLMEKGRFTYAAALYWYIISSVAVKVTEKYPILHHNDNTCDCERYFIQAPMTKTVSKIFGIEHRLSTALDIKKQKPAAQEKCWTTRTLAKYNKYVRVYSLKPRVYTYTPNEIIHVAREQKTADTHE